MTGDISGDLAEARAKIDATREALQAALDAQDGAAIRQTLARLERIADEVARVERVVEGQEAASR
jgi:hypothetical protein